MTAPESSPQSCPDCLGRGVIVTGYPSPPLCLGCDGTGRTAAPYWTRCPYCRQEFTIEGALTKHIAEQHPEHVPPPDFMRATGRKETT